MKIGQFSVEYLLVVAFALVLMAPIVYFAYSSFAESQTEIAASTANKIGYDIVNTAKNVYFLGQDSKVTLDLNFPQGIENFAVVDDPNGMHYLLIKISKSEILFPSVVKLTGTFIPENYNPGIKKVMLQSYGNYVEIKID